MSGGTYTQFNINKLFGNCGFFVMTTIICAFMIYTLQVYAFIICIIIYNSQFCLKVGHLMLELFLKIA